MGWVSSPEGNSSSKEASTGVTGAREERKGATGFISVASSNVASAGVTGASIVTSVIISDFDGPSTLFGELLLADNRLKFRVIKARIMMILVFIEFQFFSCAFIFEF